MGAVRPGWMKALLVAARFSIIAGIFVAITGVARVVADGLETGDWEPIWLAGWVGVGALPYLGGTLTGRAVRGPGDEGLLAVGVVTTLLGVFATTVWVLDGISRRSP